MIAAAVVAAAVTSFTGTFQLPASAEPVPISVELHGNTAVVALGPGHAGRQVVPANGLRFTLPGGLVFDGKTVRQGALRGTVTLRRGASRLLPALGLYRGPGGKSFVVAEPGGGLPTWRVDLPSGDIHAFRAVPKGYRRVVVRQREVRIGNIAATLTMPPGRGPFPAVVMTHGSGPQTRREFQVFAAYCVSIGIAVLADDKRGVGQSGGVYPGEVASPHTIDVLARDAQAEARYLRTLREIDRSRIGVLGDSQAGWVIALAAAREPSFRWAVPLVGPPVTVGEADTWGSLAGQGQQPPSGTKAEMLAAARSARGGFDPAPYLRRLKIPVHWVFGDDDRNVPTELCIDRLHELAPGHDFTWTTIHATHTLLELPSGLNRDIPRSRGFGRGMFTAIGAFLRAHRIVR
jgi:pimeloyl-ACP methyl ester carboxylesterase